MPGVSALVPDLWIAYHPMLRERGSRAEIAHSVLMGEHFLPQRSRVRGVHGVARGEGGAMAGGFTCRSASKKKMAMAGVLQSVVSSPQAHHTSITPPSHPDVRLVSSAVCIGASGLQKV